MADWKLQTPVAMLIYNRPDVTERVFAEVAKAKPPKLLIVADGPRPGRPDDLERCAAARAFAEAVDWDCQVITNYSETNLGCRRRVSSGLDWVFSNVDEAILLEDDCLPDQSFFMFCQDLLQKYREDNRIAQICGVNFQFGGNEVPYSYYFSRYNHIWGWATWKRAWKNYDVEMHAWPSFRDSGGLTRWLSSESMARYWAERFDKTYDKQIDTWDYQWTFACWLHGQLSVLPRVNLVSNIGFGPGATHTRKQNRFSRLPAETVHFPLSHPPHINVHDVADRFTERYMFRPSLLSQLRALFPVW